MEEKNNIPKSVLITIATLILVFAGCLFALYKIGYLSFDNKEKESSAKIEETKIDEQEKDNDETENESEPTDNKTEEVVDNNISNAPATDNKITTTKDNDIDANFAEYRIPLKKESSTVSIRKLKFDINTTKESDKEVYKYDVKISYNGNPIDTSFLADKIKFDYTYFSDEHKMQLYKMGNTYILLYDDNSRTCFNRIVFIFDQNGKIVKTYTKAELSFSVEKNGVNMHVKTSSTGNCMSNDGVTTHTYIQNGQEGILLLP